MNGPSGRVSSQDRSFIHCCFEKGALLAPFDIEPRQRFQAPPPRYSEATLVKKLEEEGIGRPVWIC